MASASKNNHDAGKKKMSLEEFFSDNSLGDSVWDEQEIDLNAIKTSISNTTSLDVLKNSSIRLDANAHGHGHGHGHGMGMGMGHGQHRDPNLSENQRLPSAPPYILKFANLPASFSNYEIEDLFKAKRAQFVKFKLFWELNKTLGAKNEPTVFQQLFKRDSKVAFVEVYSYRDMEKILTQWKTPLRELYNIRVDMPSFDDFKEYMDKDKLIDPRDDASKPYRAPEGGAAAARRRSSGEGLPPPTERRKSNPFGSAKPVDTQTKLLQIESKIDQLGIEDTKTLRRLTIGSDEEDNHENESNQEKGDRVRKSLQVLKREKNIDDNDSEAISNHAPSMSPPPSASNATTATASASAAASASATPPPKLNFMSIIKKKEQTELQEQKIKEEEAIKENAAREEELKRHAQARIDEEARRQAEDENSGDYSSGANGDDNGNGNRGSDSHGNHHHSNQNYSNNFKFKDSGNNDYNNNNRRGGGRGGSRGGRGGGRGGSYRGGSDNGNNGNRFNSDSGNNYQKRYEDRSQSHQQYGLFAPAAGFLKDQSRGDRGGRGGRGDRGGRGRGRGGYSD